MRRFSPRRDAGFSLVELMAGFLLTALILGVTARVMVAAGESAQRAAARTLDTDLSGIAALAGADLTSASGVFSNLQGDMMLLGHPVGPIIYEHRESRLTRTTGSAERILSENVAEWRWRVIPGEEDRLLVEVVVGVQRTKLGEGARFRDGVRTPIEQDVDRRRLTAMLRGGGGEGGWW